MGGKDNSISFYRSKLPYKERQFNHVFQLEPYFEEMIGDKKEVWIADLGAGLFSTTGSTWPNVEVHLYPSDILADEYRKLLIEAEVTPVIPIEKQDMSDLTYRNEFFDIVVCINALDHSEDPFLALQEMVRVCKYGGWIYLRHFINNAQNQKYSGFHKWNISDDGNGCKIWGKDDEFYLPEEFDTTVIKNEDYIVSRMQKCMN